MAKETVRRTLRISKHAAKCADINAGERSMSFTRYVELLIINDCKTKYPS